MIERCLVFQMSRDDCVRALAKHAKIEPIVTLTVWKELLKENKGFFQAYFQAISQPSHFSWDICIVVQAHYMNYCISEMVIKSHNNFMLSFFKTWISSEMHCHLQFGLSCFEPTSEGWMQLLVNADTTTLSYWLNWSVLLCSVIVLAPVVIALLIIWKYEGLKKLKCSGGDSQEDLGCDVLYDDDVWRPCLEEIHPIWLLGYRLVAFCLALATLVVKVASNGGRIYYYYTQWTFTLVTIYFGFGTLLSIYGCYRHQKISCCGCSNVQHVRIDTEEGYYTPLTNRKDTNVQRKALDPQENCNVSRAAGFISYLFQVIFQMNAGAVMLTDFIYWSIIFPFLTIRDYSLNFMTVNMHTLNVVLLLGDTALNSLVQFSGIHASTMLRHVCVDHKSQALHVVKVVPGVLPVFKIKNGFGVKSRPRIEINLFPLYCFVEGNRRRIMSKFQNPEQDRISELPDEILLQILLHLPTKDIIATCALSSRWKFLWKSLHLLILDFDFEVDSKAWRRPKWNPSVVVDWDTLQRQVEQIPDCARIRKFLLKCVDSRRPSAVTKKRTELNSLLSKLVRHKVEEVDLYIHPEWRRFRFLPWPDSLCTSDSLTTLKLDMSLELKLHLPASLGFPRLKTLHLNHVIFHQEGDPERLFSACPILEELLFRRCALISNHPPPNDELSISIPSLRRLIFEHDIFISLRINCSNLQSLEFCCFKFQLLECNLPSLAEAGPDFNTWDYSHHRLELFKRICHVKSLRLSTRTIQAFSFAKNFNVHSLPTFYNMTHLEVSDTTVPNKASLMHILPKSPNLRCLHFPEGLIFECFHKDDNLTMEEVVSFYFNRSLKSSTISKFYGNELEVNVRFHIPNFGSTCYRGYVAADVRFVGKILENADVLEKFKMELVKREVYIKDKLSSFSYADCDLFL
ncbi:hypothetical protein CCACVL1_25000 [Corchorus capsularis]|uniref:F-box domain-containing protein n=1 Tax=Corchorus capsularis TaxID=210143 RepID=A0A1R3GMC2_COCAP|nr:hypothetical protein CCACVL1_25000 [Corchorus capsularis]